MIAALTPALTQAVAPDPAMALTRTRTLTMQVDLDEFKTIMRAGPK